MAWQEQHRTRSGAPVDVIVGVGAGGTETKASRRNLPRFTTAGDGWVLAKDQALPPNERPDLAYRRMFQTAGSTVWFDPKGRRMGVPTSPAVALTTDRAGARIAARGLAYEVYRTGVNADGSGTILLSRDGMLHAYTEKLEPLLTEDIAALPEYAAQAKR